MTTVPVGIGAYKRAYSGAPEVRLENRYVEKAPTNLKEHVALISRPGTTEFATFDADTSVGKIRCSYSAVGMFGGDLFVVSGHRLWRHSATSTADIAGTVAGSREPRVTWAKGDGYEYLFIADGTKLQYYDGVTEALQEIATPDDVDITALASLNSYVLASVEDSQRFYWLNPGEVTIDPLNFATKEGHPDPIVEMAAVGDVLVLAGEGSTEYWSATGDATAPFAPIRGRAIGRGIVPGTLVVLGSSEYICVGNDWKVYRVGDSPVAISDNGIEERIRMQLRREANL